MLARSKFLLPLFTTVVGLLIAIGGFILTPQASASPVAEQYAERALELVAERHLNSRKADWKKLKAEFRQRLSGDETTSDTYTDIEWLLMQLGEKHSFLIRPGALKQQGVTTSGKRATTSMPQVTWVGRDIRLVNLPPLITFGAEGEMLGRQYEASLRQELSDPSTPPICGWIVDLRQNTGGNMWPMLNGLGSLLGPSPLGYFMYPDGSNVPWVRVNGRISTGERSMRPTPKQSSDNKLPIPMPVAVLIGPNTMSSGEMVAIAFRGRTNTRFFGSPSAGLTTGDVPHTLSDGAVLVLTETGIADYMLRPIRGPIEAEVSQPSRDGLESAVNWLHSFCATR